MVLARVIAVYAILFLTFSELVEMLHEAEVDRAELQSFDLLKVRYIFWQVRVVTPDLL